MPLVNIVDFRANSYRFRKIDAVVEATWHDNRIKNADHVTYVAVAGGDGPHYAKRSAISVSEAIEWADTFFTAVTLSLHDHQEVNGAAVSHSNEERAA